MEFSISEQVITSYKRLSYTPWHAIAEFVDNSTQAYFDNRDKLDKAFEKDDEPGLSVSIVYERNNSSGFLRISDNSIGMSKEELENAMRVAYPPSNPTGRSRYGMGLKTAACWIGNKWTVRTKKLGETTEHQVTIDVLKISQGNRDLNYKFKNNRPKNEHYTIVEIVDHNRKFHGRTLGKIKDFLRSMYRQDFRNESLVLEWQGEKLSWQRPELLKSPDGSEYYKTFHFTVDKKTVTSWVGLLKKGTRSWAGFSILHSNRVIRGWPDAWRPESIYGQYLGSNDLINQRVIGEISLDEFDVSHTKDDILWLGTQQEDVEKKLYENSKDYMEIAKTRRYRGDERDERGPNPEEVDVAVDEVRAELESPEIVDQLEITDIPDAEIIKTSQNKLIVDVTEHRTETILAKIGSSIVKVYLANELSPNDPYVLVESTKDSEVMVIINTEHPHWLMLKASEGVANYLRHCIYDGISEWKAMRKLSRIDPTTIKTIKDGLLRLPLLIEKNQTSEESD